MTAHASSREIVFTGAAGNRLVGDVFGDVRGDRPGETGRPVLLLHGGGLRGHLDP